MLSNFHITLEEEEWGELNYTGWEYSAWCSFVYCNRMRKYYHKLTPAKKIKKHHGFYDFITRITKEDGLDIEPRFVEKCVLLDDYSHITKPKNRGHTGDHPFSSRFGISGIMTDHQYLLDDFETWKTVFKFFAENILKVSKQTNQDVKYIKDKNERGNILVPKLIKDRYVYKKGNVPKGMKEGDPMVFFDIKTKNWVTGFPLPIQYWFLELEKDRLITPVGNLEEFV